MGIAPNATPLLQRYGEGDAPRPTSCRQML
jgi:hypothetical protein